MSGNYAPVQDAYKTFGIFKEKIEVSAKVQPDEQQRKFYKNVETLLKLKLPGGEVQEALPEKTGKVIKERYDDVLPGPVKLPDFIQKEIDETIKPKAETKDQGTKTNEPSDG